MHGYDMEPVELISGGPPCQDFSIASSQIGLSGSRGDCTLEMIRIIREMREKYGKPRWVLFENVYGIFSSNGGEDFREIIEGFCRAKDGSIHVPAPSGKWTNAGCIVGNGFSLAWRVLNAKYFGVPQNRRRVAILVDYDGTCAPDILFEQRDRDGCASDHKERCERNDLQIGMRTEGTPAADTGSAGRRITYSVKVRGGVRFDSKGKEAGKGALVNTEIAGTIGQPRDQVFVSICDTGNIIHKPTPIEYERLQAFPDDWTLIDGYADANGEWRNQIKVDRYRAVGNSLATVVWMWIMRRIASMCGDDVTLGSLFDGIGGFRLVWERVCGGRTVWASEIDPFCLAVTKERFGE